MTGFESTLYAHGYSDGVAIGEAAWLAVEASGGPGRGPKTREAARDAFFEACADIDENRRQYTEFSWLAGAINDLRTEETDLGWEAYNNGLDAGMEAAFNGEARK